MVIKGIQKMSMVDYPNLLCTTLFTPGCNLRCPFCHNSELVLPEKIEEGFLKTEEIFEFLEGRKHKIDAVCLSGGEPLLQTGVPEFLLAVKKMGFKVKLDTNGTFPEKLAEVLEKGAADYVAMDIKNSPENYGKTVGVKNFDMAPIFQSIELLKSSPIEYEFRTTVSKTFHTENSLIEAGRMIEGADKWFLQAFRSSDNVIDQNVEGFTEEELKDLLKKLQKFAKIVNLRGI